MWGYLVIRALQSLPGHLAAADPAMPRQLARFAGRSLGAKLELGRAEISLLLRFDSSGVPKLERCQQIPEDCDLLLHRQGRRLRLDGDRQLALRLLAVARRWRPDLEDALELWFGTLPSGLAANAKDAMRTPSGDPWPQRLRELLQSMRPMPSSEV